LIDAAIRETKEEVGITISKTQISNVDEPLEVIYYNKKKQVHKIVYLYLVNINNLSEIGLETEIGPKKQLQVEEVDWAGFLTAEEIKEKSFHRFLSLVDLIK
jgi:8-oxo-dGTP pyrophosphatase MutT (NUDIX family)